MRVWIAIFVGSTLISRAACAWIAGGPVPRLLALVLAAGFAKGLPVTSHLLALGAAGWLGTAITLGLRAPDPTAAQAPPEPPQEKPADEPSLPTPEQLAEALHKVADPHAHLAAVATALDTSTDRVREALTAAGIPVSGGVRMGGRVSTGVKAGHFPPLPTPAPDGDVAVVDAGQSNNNNEEEYVQDEKNPNRWRVLRRV
jgi:hypothetical protein